MSNNTKENFFENVINDYWDVLPEDMQNEIKAHYEQNYEDLNKVREVYPKNNSPD
tara:strand:- start:104 stop:268 length:165 start_codon:yes stop_codon:yes gene_type:complete